MALFAAKCWLNATVPIDKARFPAHGRAARYSPVPIVKLQVNAMAGQADPFLRRGAA